MQRALRLFLAVMAGVLVGSLVNMALIALSGTVLPPPAGADVSTVEGMKASMHLFEPKHFIVPFVAHGLGTFVGALIATWITPGRTSGPAYVVGVVFLLGGIAAAFMLPAPLWFEALDLVVAYIPFAWLGHRLASRGAAGRATGTFPGAA